MRNKLLILLPLFILCTISVQGAVYEGIIFNKYEYAPGDVVDLHVEMDVEDLVMQIDASSLIDDFNPGMVAQRSEGKDYYFRFFLPRIDKDPDIYPVLINAYNREEDENRSDAMTVNFNLINYTSIDGGIHGLRLLIEQKRTQELPVGFVLREVLLNNTISICENDNCTVMDKGDFQKTYDDATIVNDSYNEITAFVTSEMADSKDDTTRQISQLDGNLATINRQMVIMSADMKNAEDSFRTWTIRQGIVFAIGILAMALVFGAWIYVHHLRTRTGWLR